VNRDTKIVVPNLIESIAGILYLELQEYQNERTILIEIGDIEATNLFLAMNSETFISNVLDTHDLYIESLTAFGIEIVGGILTYSNGDVWEGSLELLNLNTNETVYIDCRPTDIFTILLKLGLPIHIYEDLLETYQIDEKERQEKNIADSIEHLENMLAKYVEEEDYEKAEIIKIMINKRKGT
jgi:bifunctional DNase/RNase